MYNKILVALDHSPEASLIFDAALSVAQAKTSEILLVHFIDWQNQDVSPWMGVATLYDVDLSAKGYERNRQHLQLEIERCQSWLESLAIQANKLDISCNYECQVANCNLGIGDRAKQWGADLIVVGRRGHRNISEVLLGSVSNYVIHHAPCSVLVIQGNKTRETDELTHALEV